MRSLAVLTAESRRGLGSQSKPLPQLGTAAWEHWVGAEAVSTRETEDAWRDGAPAGPTSRCRLSPGQATPLQPNVRTQLTMKSRSQAHLRHLFSRTEQVMPFLGAKGTGAGRSRGEQGALTQGSGHILHSPLPGWLFHARTHLPSCSGHMGDIWGTTFCQKNLSSAPLVCPACRQLKKIPS